jgi:methionyl-tRNA formyltransferase
MEGRRVVDFIRGLSPYPAATMLMEDEKGQAQSFKVFQASWEPQPNTTVGQVVTDNKLGLKIGVKDGLVSIINLQLSGKKRITAEEFLRGHDVRNWKIVF